MYYFIEALVWFCICYYWSKWFGYRSILVMVSIVYPLVVVLDPLLYQWGFIWTAHTLILSLMINTVPYVASLMGIVIQKVR